MLKFPARLLNLPPHSTPLHSDPLDPLAPREASSPVPPVVPPGVGSGSESDSYPNPVISGSASFDPPCAAAFSLADFQSMPVCSHHLRGTRVPRRLSATSHSSRIGLVAINCTTVFCLQRIDVLTLMTPDLLEPPPERGKTIFHRSLDGAAVLSAALLLCPGRCPGQTPFSPSKPTTPPQRRGPAVSLL